VGSRIRFAGTLADAKLMGDGGVQITTRVTVELEGSDRPACVADILSRFYF
jgi:acyl dehydratase